MPEIDHPEDVRRFFDSMEPDEKLRFVLLVDTMGAAAGLAPPTNRPSTGGGDHGGRFETPYTTVSAVAGK